MYLGKSLFWQTEVETQITKKQQKIFKIKREKEKRKIVRKVHHKLITRLKCAQIIKIHTKYELTANTKFSFKYIH